MLRVRGIADLPPGEVAIAKIVDAQGPRRMSWMTSSTSRWTATNRASVEGDHRIDYAAIVDQALSLLADRAPALQTGRTLG